MTDIETRICTICGLEVEVSTPCPHCSDETNWRDVSAMTGDEKIAEFERWMTLQVSVELWRKRMKQLFGRPVHTHEIATSNFANLHAELITGLQPTFEDIVELIPAEKRLIVADPRDNDQEQPHD